VIHGNFDKDEVDLEAEYDEEQCEERPNGRPFICLATQELQEMK
jgi:hypothetical protein